MATPPSPLDHISANASSAFECGGTETTLVKARKWSRTGSWPLKGFVDRGESCQLTQLGSTLTSS
jgi:hypothetical protein